jgi:hypothetical protein
MEIATKASTMIYLFQHDYIERFQYILIIVVYYVYILQRTIFTEVFPISTCK